MDHIIKIVGYVASGITIITAIAGLIYFIWDMKNLEYRVETLQAQLDLLTGSGAQKSPDITEGFNSNSIAETCSKLAEKYVEANVHSPLTQAADIDRLMKRLGCYIEEGG